MRVRLRGLSHVLMDQLVTGRQPSWLAQGGGVSGMWDCRQQSWGSPSANQDEQATLVSKPQPAALRAGSF